MRGLELEAGALDFLFNMCRSLHRGFFGRPDLLEISVFLLEPVELLLEVRKALQRCIVRLFLERFAFDLELDDAAVEPIHGLGLRIDFDANARGGLVDEVDRLVRQLAVADVPV